MANNKSLTKEELMDRANKKIADIEIQKAHIEDEATFKDILTIEPREALSLMEHYNTMPEVEVDSKIGEFWRYQQEELNKLDMKTPQDEYINAFKEYQDLQESIDEKNRDDMGVNSLINQEAKAKEQIRAAEERKRDAKRKLAETKDEVDPLTELKGFILGNSKEYRTVRDAARELRNAKKGVRDAKQALLAIKERQGKLQEYKDRLSVKEHLALRKMLNAKTKIADNRYKAAKIDEQSQTIQAHLTKQYEIVDKYKSIQKFKNSNEYSSVRTILKSNNKPLFDELESIPQNLPQNVLKISIENPLQENSLPIDQSRITKVESEISKIKGKLPSNINMDNLDAEIGNYTIKPGETIQSIEEDMKEMDPSSKEYKQLELKKSHLEFQQKVEYIQEEITTLKEELKNFSGSAEELQAKLSELKTKQEYVKILEAELGKDSYSQTLSELHQLQTLMNEKEKLEAPKYFSNLTNVAQNLENSTTINSRTGSIADIYKLIQESIKRQRESYMKSIEKPKEQQRIQSGDER